MPETPTTGVTPHDRGEPISLPEPDAGTDTWQAAGIDTVDEDRRRYEQSLSQAFGGRRGLADLGLPGLLFIVVYTPTRDLAVAAWASFALAAVFTLVRLVRRESPQHALSGVVFVGLCAFLAAHTGSAKNFFLPDLVINGVFLPLCAVTALCRWPLVGVVLGPVTGEYMAWRDVPARLRAFSLATWVLAGVFAVRLLLEVPLYLGNQVTALGIVHTITAYPLYAAALYVCWQIIRKAPPPVRAEEPTEKADEPAES